MKNLEIIKSTKKAHLIKIDGIEFWIQKRWLKADNTLTPAGLKSFENAKDFIKYNKKYSEVAIEDYSEKCVKVLVDLEYCNLEKSRNVFFFAPKSMLGKSNSKYIASLPNWFIDKKLRETEDFWKKPNTGDVFATLR